MRRAAAWATLCLALGGCVAETGPPPKGGCAAVGMQALLGQPARAAEDLPEPRRIIPHDGIVTQDFRPDRSNASLTRDGRIARLWCG